MSEQNQNQQNTQEAERPPVSPEQQRAFRTTYAQLMKKAREGDQDPLMTTKGLTADFHLSPKIYSGARQAFDIEKFIANTSGGDYYIETDEGKRDVWIYAFNENYAHETGKLAEFTVGRDLTASEQDTYDFYPDGNIERLHWTYKSLDEIDDEDEVATDAIHVSWLTPEETEDLGRVIEDCQFQPNAPGS